MCFVVDKQYPDELIAEEDILVIKEGNVTNEEFIAKIYGVYKYLKYELQPEIILIKDIFTREVIDKGYHSYWEMCYPGPNTGLFKIPKGSKYYINIYWKEIVSNQLVYLRPLEVGDLTEKNTMFCSNLKIDKLKIMWKK